jgi:cytochrome c-type biogenesis protein
LSLAEAAAGQPSGEPLPLWRQRAFGWSLGLAALAALSSPLWWGPLSGLLYDLEFGIAELLPEELIASANWALLPAMGFGAGLLASLSPCVLPLVPLNVAYIGAADASGGRALALSARFVLGAAIALSVLGLFGDLAGVLLIEQRGPVLISVGLVLVYFGLAAVEIAPVPFAGRSLGGNRQLGAVGAGAVFSLVTTPCASPLVGAVLAAAAAQGVPGLSVVSMAAFALGYTAIVFVAGVFGGNLVQRLRGRSFEAPRAVAGALMLAAGAAAAFAGISWFL